MSKQQPFRIGQSPEERAPSSFRPVAVRPNRSESVWTVANVHLTDDAARAANRACASLNMSNREFAQQAILFALQHLDLGS
jgi:hypothetical protein